MKFKDHKCNVMQGDGILHYDPENGLHLIVWCQQCGKNAPESISIKEIEVLSKQVSSLEKKTEKDKAWTRKIETELGENIVALKKKVESLEKLEKRMKKLEKPCRHHFCQKDGGCCNCDEEL